MSNQTKIFPAFSKHIFIENNKESLLAENARLKSEIRKLNYIISAFKGVNTRNNNLK